MFFASLLAFATCLIMLAIDFAKWNIIKKIDQSRCDIIKAIHERDDADSQKKIQQVLSIVEANKAKMQKAVDDNK